MNLWGPYLPLRAWGTGMSKQEDTTYEAACSNGKFLDGIFGFGNSHGTVKASFAFWNGHDSHLKERLFDARERYLHGLCDPQHRYFSCRYIYPQTAFPYEASPASLLPYDQQCFNLHFELAKQQPTKLFYRLTVTNTGDATADLTLVAQLWICHAVCGRVSQLDGGNCLRVSATGSCCGKMCSHIVSSCNKQECSPICESRIAFNYLLHYQPDGLETVAFSDAASPGAFNRLIVHGDDSQLVADAPSCRAALVYRLTVPANDSLSLCFHLSSDTSEVTAVDEAPVQLPEPPCWKEVPKLMQHGARLAAQLLTATLSDELPKAVKQVARRAYSNILWNRQYCSCEALGQACLAVVPDRWVRPGLGSPWEHCLHAVVLCRVNAELAAAELDCQRSRLLANGESVGAIAAPPVWPLAALEIIHCQVENEFAESFFLDAMRHMNWWLLKRKDAKGRNTIDGGILGLDHRGWRVNTHSSETNDSLFWSGFFCAKLFHLAVILERPEVKTLLDLFNIALGTLRNEVAVVDGLFSPRFADERLDRAAADVAGRCSCALGLVPLLGCACIPWDPLTDSATCVLIEWLLWLSNQLATTEMPSLFVKTESTRSRFLVSWIGEAEFVGACAALFSPEHFLSPYGIRCSSIRLSDLNRDESECPCCRTEQLDAVSVPLNYLLIEALKCWEAVYGQQMQLEYPSGSGMRVSLNHVIVDISQRIVNIFLMIDDETPMFFELYRADNGKGIGPRRHVSWRSLVARIAENVSRQPTHAESAAPCMPPTLGRIAAKNSVLNALHQIFTDFVKMEDL